MKLAVAAVGTCLALAACAGLVERDCRSDPYQLGVRDARMALEPQIDRYAGQCKAYGSGPDAARYMEGWRSAYHFHPFGP